MNLFLAKKVSLVSLVLVTCLSATSIFADELVDVVLVEKSVEIVEVAEEVVPVTNEVEPVFILAEAQKSPVAFQSLEQLDELVRLGMPALALRLLTHEQEKLPSQSSDWYAFERKHIVLLSTLNEWQQVIVRTNDLLKHADSAQKIPTQIYHWFSTQQVVALLRLGKADEALTKLRTLLWHLPAATAVSDYSDIIALWRRLVVRAYLAMNADNDAQKSLLRYQHDYSSNHQNLNLDWRLLQARTLMRIGRNAEAITLLADSKTHIAQALRLLAAVRVYPDNAQLYAQEAQSYIEASKLNLSEMWSYHYVVYQAFLAQNKLTDATRVLTKLLLQHDAYSALGGEFRVVSDDLWSLYEAIGMKIGNESNLLQGDDLAWYNNANELQKKNSVEALGLYVVLAFNASDVRKKQMAHKEVVAFLAKNKNGLELINRLYLHGTKVSSLESLPLEVRYSLIDYALSKSDMTLAVRLMRSVQQPPQGEDEFSWSMRKARVMILEGIYDKGEAVLDNALKNIEQITQDQLDQFLQVVFDLQAVGRHQQVLILLDTLKPEWMNDGLRRELFYWKAESYTGLEQYDRAAWSYLKSAQLAGQSQAELWAQSARFKAAGVLVKANLFNDAQSLYLQLLDVTASDSRKSAIKQELQQIRLLRNAEKNQIAND